MYFSCLLIRNIISFSVRPAESPGHDVGSVVSKLKRSSRNSARGSHLSPGGLGERLYWFPRPPERERSKPPDAAGARFVPCHFRWPTPTGTDPELKGPHEGARSSHGPSRPPRMLGISRATFYAFVREESKP